MFRRIVKAITGEVAPQPERSADRLISDICAMTRCSMPISLVSMHELQVLLEAIGKEIIFDGKRWRPAVYTSNGVLQCRLLQVVK